jgi:hypothetical protein
LKEDFDRFNFGIYKEKEMADFRRWFTVLAVLALMAGAASAQIGVQTGSASNALQCVANAAGTPQLRQEGYTELLGDILITCTGGAVTAPGTLISTTTITLYTSPALPITSRLMTSSSQVSDALLLIDDPGSSLPTGAVGKFGPHASQILCTTIQGGCPAYAEMDSGSTVTVMSATNTGAAGTGDQAVANVYQGVLGAQGTNTVTFYGVPVLPPASAGISRTFRITNVRVPTVGMANQQTISVFVSTNPSTILPIQQANLSVGIVGQPMTAAVSMKKTANPFPQCQAQVAALTATLSYTEGFATMFKTRIVPQPGATAYYSQGGGNAVFGAQNVPGGLYSGYAQNSESGFIMAGDAYAVTSKLTYTAGLADFGTRLKAVFTNIPAGVTLYVSNASTGTAPVPVGGVSQTPYAILVAGSSTSDNVADPAAQLTTGVVTGSDGYSAFPLVQSSGSAAAVWEVVNSGPSSIDTLNFSVYIGYNPAAASSTNPYGLPAITGQLGAAVDNVAMSFAPEPGGASFSTANAQLPGTNPIPRFAVVNTYQGPWVTVILCQTTLMYPFVTANPSGGLGQGFDTGIAVANTSSDPFTALSIIANYVPGGTTLAESGSCTLYPYGSTMTSTGTVGAAPPVVKGCDAITNPVSGSNCFPVVPSGTVGSVLASAVLPNFTGYVIAVCNFQYAHGYAAVTDLGLRGLFSSYLALEVNTTFGNPRGVGIEQLVH